MKRLIVLFFISFVTCNLRNLFEEKSDIEDIIKILLESYKKIKEEYKKSLNESKSEEIIKTFKSIKDFSQKLDMKYHQGIHPQHYENMIKRLVVRMGTNKNITDKLSTKLNEIGKDKEGKWIHERILYSQDPIDKKGNYTYAAYLNLFGKKDQNTGKVTLCYTTVTTKFKMQKMLFVHKKSDDTIERRDIDLKPEEIDENDIKVIMGYGDLVSLKYFKTYFNIKIPIEE